MKQLLVLICLITGVICGPVTREVHAFASSSRVPMSSGAAARVDSYLTGLTGKHQFSGVVLLAQGGRILLSKGYGLADRKHHVPNTPTTKYLASRFTVTLPALGLLQLAQRGNLSLTDRVCKYISGITGCQWDWKRVTIREVLNFTSGIGDYDWESAHSLKETIRGCKSEPLNSVPGTTAAVGQCVTVIMTLILERVSGQSWGAYMRQHIFGPAGMTSSGRVTDALKPPNRAARYSGVADVDHSGYNNIFFAYSTALDLFRYDRALFGGKLLSNTLLRALMTPGPAVEPPDPQNPYTLSPGISDVHYGYGWRVGSVNGRRVVFTYAPDAATTANFEFPQSGLTIVLLANDDTYAIRTITTTVIRDALHG